jgi:hypothetical protein
MLSFDPNCDLDLEDRCPGVAYWMLNMKCRLIIVNIYAQQFQNPMKKYGPDRKIPFNKSCFDMYM